MSAIPFRHHLLDLYLQVSVRHFGGLRLLILLVIDLLRDGVSERKEVSKLIASSSSVPPDVPSKLDISNDLGSGPFGLTSKEHRPLIPS